LGVLIHGELAIEAENLPVYARIVIQDAKLLAKDNFLNGDLKALSTDVCGLFRVEDSNISSTNDAEK
jgi:hypothetical protein